MNPAQQMAHLLRAGFADVGISIPVEQDETSVAVRNLLIEFDGKISCLAHGDDDMQTVFTMPMDAMESAACAVVMRILNRYVAQRVECAYRSLQIQGS